jgi:hypothetical protein
MSMDRETGSYFAAGIGMFAGWLIGAPMLGASVGYMLYDRLMPTDEDGDEGKQHPEFRVDGFERNRPVPIVYGTDKIDGTVIWLSDVDITIETTVIGTTPDTGGGMFGGGSGDDGGTDITQETVVYNCSFALALGEGNFKAIYRILVNEQEIWETDPAAIQLTWNMYDGRQDLEWFYSGVEPMWPFIIPSDYMMIEGFGENGYHEYEPGPAYFNPVTYGYGIDFDFMDTKYPVHQELVDLGQTWIDTAFLHFSGGIGGFNVLPNIAVEARGKDPYGGTRIKPMDDLFDKINDVLKTEPCSIGELYDGSTPLHLYDLYFMVLYYNGQLIPFGDPTFDKGYYFFTCNGAIYSYDPRTGDFVKEVEPNVIADETPYTGTHEYTKGYMFLWRSDDRDHNEDFTAGRGRKLYGLVGRELGEYDLFVMDMETKEFSSIIKNATLPGDFADRGRLIDFVDIPSYWPHYGKCYEQFYDIMGTRNYESPFGVAPPCPAPLRYARTPPATTFESLSLQFMELVGDRIMFGGYTTHWGNTGAYMFNWDDPTVWVSVVGKIPYANFEIAATTGMGKWSGYFNIASRISIEIMLEYPLVGLPWVYHPGSYGNGATNKTYFTSTPMFSLKYRWLRHRDRFVASLNKHTGGYNGDVISYPPSLGVNIADFPANGVLILSFFSGSGMAGYVPWSPLSERAYAGPYQNWCDISGKYSEFLQTSWSRGYDHGISGQTCRTGNKVFGWFGATNGLGTAEHRDMAISYYPFPASQGENMRFNYGPDGFRLHNNSHNRRDSPETEFWLGSLNPQWNADVRNSQQRMLDNAQRSSFPGHNTRYGSVMDEPINGPDTDHRAPSIPQFPTTGAENEDVDFIGFPTMSTKTPPTLICLENEEIYYYYLHYYYDWGGVTSLASFNAGMKGCYDNTFDRENVADIVPGQELTSDQLALLTPPSSGLTNCIEGQTGPNKKIHLKRCDVNGDNEEIVFSFDFYAVAYEDADNDTHDHSSHDHVYRAAARGQSVSMAQFQGKIYFALYGQRAGFEVLAPTTQIYEFDPNVSSSGYRPKLLGWLYCNECLGFFVETKWALWFGQPGGTPPYMIMSDDIYDVNPVWALYDFLTNERYGMGLPHDEVDGGFTSQEEWEAFDIDDETTMFGEGTSFKACYDYCEEMVPIGGLDVGDEHKYDLCSHLLGGDLEKRYSAAFSFNRRLVGFEFLKEILQTFNGYLFKCGRKLSVGMRDLWLDPSETMYFGADESGSIVSK